MFSEQTENEIGSNPYLDSVEAELVEAMNKKSDFERNFNLLEQGDAYVENKKTIINLVIELIKFGRFTKNDKNVVVTVNDTSCELPKSLIKEYMDKNQYEKIFGNDEVEDEEVPAKEEASASEPKHIKVDAEMLPNVPPYFYQFPPYMPPVPYPMFGEFQMFSSESSALMKTITDIQERLKNLEENKSEQPDNSEEIENLKNALASAQQSLEESRKNATELENTVVKAEEEGYKKENRIKELLIRIENLEKDLSASKEALEEANSKRKSFFREKDDTVGKLENEISNLKRERSELDNRVDKLNKEKNTLESQLNNAKNDLERERNQHIKEIQDLNLTRNQLIDKAAADAKVDSAKEIENLNARVKELENELANAKKSSSDTKSHFEDLKNEITSLKVDRDNCQKKIEKLESEKSVLAQEKNKDERKVEELKTSLKEMEKLAYVDTKTGLKNNNAFNEDFPNYNKNELILAVVGICGMKFINDEYGRSSGDQVIMNVAEELKNAFPNSTIYRILGDQFFICSTGITLNNVQGELSDVSRKLLFDEIKIAYGTSVGNNCKDHRELLLAAETNMNKMKNLPSNEITDQIYKRVQEEVSPIAPRVVKRNDNEVQEIDLDEQIAEMVNSQS